MGDLKRHLHSKRIMKLRFFIACIFHKGGAEYIRKHKMFNSIGDYVLYQPKTLPNEPKLIKIHNNVKIAAGVLFYTHDVINTVFEYMDYGTNNTEDRKYQTHGSCIEIHDNVFVGGNTIIVGNVSIGPDVIIAAGSVVRSDIPKGVIAAGNPAVIVGDFYKLHEKRRKQDGGKQSLDPNDRSEELWKHFYEYHGVK